MHLVIELDLPDELATTLEEQPPELVQGCARRALEEFAARRKEMADLATTPPSRLLSLADAATALGLPLSKVRMMVKDGTLKSVPVGRLRYIPSHAINDLS